MATYVEALSLSKTVSTQYELQKLDKYSVLRYKRNSNYYEAREKKNTTKSFKKFISSPNDGNIIGICNMLQREEKCMQNSIKKN